MNGFFYIILYYGLSIFVEYIKCDQVVLLDTTKEATLEWTRYPYGPQAQTPGWVEESFTNFGKGINWRSYVVCDVAYNNVNNWLWSPFIDRGPANRLYIEIQFTIRDCSLFPGNALSCKETFSLLFYEFDAATREPPPWQPESYKLIARIAAGEGRFNQNSDVDINTEVKSIAVTKKGVYFAFRDQGACISVLAVKVFYVTCPAVTINFAKFNETPTGREITIIEQQFGICVENAEIIEMPKYLCKGDGKWTLPSGGCRCKLGFEGDTNLQHCKKCPRDFFRSDDVNNCTRCPENSRASEEGSLFCKCDDGYFRYPKQKKNTPCRKPPPSPINISLLFVDASSAVIEWKGLENNLYHIECITCSSNVIFHPQYKYFNQTKITLTNLESLTTYFMKIYALNEFLTNQEDDNGDILISLPNNDELDDGSSEILKIFNFIDFNFTTKEATIFYERNDNNLRISTAKPNAILISWTKSNDNDLEMYQIKYFESIEKKSHGSQATTIKTIYKIVDKSLNQVLIDNLESNRKYGFQIRTKTSRKGWSEYSPIVYAQTISSSSSTLSNNVINNNNYDSEKGDIYSSEDDSSEMRFFASISVAVVVFLVLTIIALVFFLRTKHQDDFIVEKKAATMEKNPLDYASNDDFFGTTNSRSYVDPHTYEDPNQAVREFAREIDASCITIEAIIGGGEFGDVCRGRLKIPYGPEIDVAIKTLKPNSTEKSRFDFLTEASIMGQFQHPNIIYLQGVVTKTTPVMIVTEFMENGSLDTFLRANDGKFSMLQLIEMLRGIASGMAYLSEMNYVHRDLAARNVLVNSALTCKIADFGLSREIETASDAYTTRGGKIPIRWTAPEAIAFRKFSSASDTWSFGIVMWEVTSFGERPYWNWSNHDVIKSIEKGYRLPAPENCPEGLYQLMLDCWQRQKIHRPNFRTIEKILDNFIKNPATIFNTIQKTSLDNSNRINQVYVDEYFVSVDFWLEKIKMERYKGVFLERGIVTKEQISRLTATQLSDMGITLVGHQKKILHQARQLRNGLKRNKWTSVQNNRKTLCHPSTRIIDAIFIIIFVPATFCIFVLYSKN